MDRLRRGGSASVDRLPLISRFATGSGSKAPAALALGGAVFALAVLVGLTLTGAPVQAAFHQNYASQCGYCTPGMLIAAHAYLEGGGTDDRAAIQEALAGHICRCTGYVKILEAVGTAARGDAAELERNLEVGEEPPVEIKGSPA